MDLSKLDSNNLRNCLKNILTALNKANLNGSFDIQESYKIFVDLDYIAKSSELLINLQQQN
jgi:hypothetical protein